MTDIITRPSRRAFLRAAALSIVSTTLPAALRSTPAGAVPAVDETGAHPAWSDLRQVWFDLSGLMEGGYPTLAERQASHLQTLQQLVAAGELRAELVEPMQIAFEEAGYHLAAQTVDCYAMMPAVATNRANLMQQTDLLEVMSVESDIDPATVETARTAIAREMVLLSQIRADRVATGVGDIPPDVLEAAGILVSVLLTGSP